MRTTPNRRLTKLDAMRNGQNKRMRGRNRKSQNPLTRVYESNGPDVKVRGTAAHIAEKYVQLARDAQSSGDPVAAENYYQHAEHYFRLIAAVQDQFRSSQPYFRDGESREGDDEDDEGFEQGAGGEPYTPREQPQPYSTREQQPFPPREQRPPREQSQSHSARPPAQPAVPADDVTDIEKLPAFVTGGAAQGASSVPANGQNGFEGAPDRFPLHRRRRRRPHTPREGAASGEAAESASGAPGE
jgi:hypothetical protein